MNLFNRLVVIVLDLLLIAASVLTALAAAFPGPAFAYARHSAFTAAWFALLPARPLERGGVIAGAVALCFSGVVLLFMELRERKVGEELLLHSHAHGDVVVRTDSVRRLAEYVAGQLPNVREVQSRVVPTAQGLRLHCRVAVDPSASVPDLARDLQAKVSAAVEQHLGRPVEKISVAAQITPITQARRRVR
jgi:hypothetical protein